MILRKADCSPAILPTYHAYPRLLIRHEEVEIQFKKGSMQSDTLSGRR